MRLYKQGGQSFTLEAQTDPQGTDPLGNGPRFKIQISGAIPDQTYRVALLAEIHGSLSTVGLCTNPTSTASYSITLGGSSGLTLNDNIDGNDSRNETQRMMLYPEVTASNDGTATIRVPYSISIMVNGKRTSACEGVTASEARAWVRLTMVYIGAPTPTPQYGSDPTLDFNEYVMIGGGYPFVVPCTIVYHGSDVNTLEWIRSVSNWTLTRPPGLTVMPGALAGIANGSEIPTNGYPFVFPRFQSDQPPLPAPIMRGLGFSTLSGLPPSNASFGPYTVNHNLGTTLSGTSPLEIFYDSAVHTHPASGTVLWCDLQTATGHSRYDDDTWLGAPNTPNWFYYYSQAWPPPCLIAYDSQGSSAFGGSWYDADNGGNHVHISNDAHGYHETRLWEVRPNYGPYLVHVGFQKSYGIDTFAKVVTHEYTHKLVHDTYAGMPDTDGDGLPDTVEEGLDLDPGDADSTDFGISYPAYGPNGNNHADQDVYCQMQEIDVRGSRDADWASDGLNKGATPGSNDSQRDPKIYYPAPMVPPG